MSGILKAVLAIIRSVKNDINKAITHILLIIAILLVILLLPIFEIGKQNKNFILKVMFILQDKHYV